jgi:hypothetical protein
MTSDRETARLVREWLDDGETRLPDRVLDAVLDQVPVTSQRRRLRWLHFSAPVIPTALAAAAVVAMAFLGLNFLRTADVGGPDPSTAPSATPDVRATLEFWSGREMPAGEYVIDEPFPARITMAVPDGWNAFGMTKDLAAICTNDCEQPDRVGLGFWVVSNVYDDACDVSGAADPPIGSSVEDLVGALLGMSRHVATEPRAEMIGGHPATYLELTADADLGDCALPGFRAWIAGQEVRESPPGERDRLWILEVDGVRLMVDLAIPPNAPASDVAELEAVIDSLRIGH